MSTLLSKLRQEHGQEKLFSPSKIAHNMQKFTKICALFSTDWGI